MVKGNTENYRLILLLPIVSKVLERYVFFSRQRPSVPADPQPATWFISGNDFMIYFW